METTPPKSGLFRRLFSWKTLRIALILITALVTLLVALVTEENWRARRDWEKYKSEQEAKGVRFTRYDGMGQDEAGIWTTPSGDRVAWFTDPDGNTLSLTTLAAR